MPLRAGMGRMFGAVRDTFEWGELMPVVIGVAGSSFIHTFVETWAEQKLVASGRPNAGAEATAVTSAAIGGIALAVFGAAAAGKVKIDYGYLSAGVALNELSEAVDLTRAVFLV